MVYAQPRIYSWEWDAQTPLEFWDLNGSPDLSQTTSLIYIHNICGNIVKNNDGFNERTNTLLYENISLTLYSRKGWCWLCVRDELETGTDCYILTPSSSDHKQHFFRILAGLLKPLVPEGPNPSVCRWISIRHLVPNWLQLRLARSASGNWLYNCLTHSPASAVLPLIYIGVSLDWRLGRGSICYSQDLKIINNKKEELAESWTLLSRQTTY